MSLLNVSGETKISFLSGLIEAGGNASYINEEKSRENVVSIFLMYHAELQLRRLMMTLFDRDEGFDHPDILQGSGATHVVMQVLGVSV